MSQKFRHASIGRVDRSQTITFTFDGVAYDAFEGDTLATGLLANGVHLTGRSFKYHRPRGIVAAGVEEPNALVTLHEGAYLDPNNRATVVELFDGLNSVSQNRSPSLKFDIGAVNNTAIARVFSAGFYYKSFMELGNWGWNHVFEPIIRRAAGLGKAPTVADPDRYEKLYCFCDVLVVGSGPAGLLSAVTAARSGARVILAEQDFELGGSTLCSNEEIDGLPAADWAAAQITELEAAENVTILRRAAVTSFFDHNYLGIWQKLTDHMPPEDSAGQTRHKFHRTRAKQVIFATGALERPVVFANNDRPGIMMASAARGFLNRYGVLPGNKGVAIVNHDGAMGAVLDLANAGVEFSGVVDVRPNSEGPLTDQVRALGIDVITDHVVVTTNGHLRVKDVEIAPKGETNLKKTRKLECDFVITSSGWNPIVHLHCQAAGKLNWDADQACFVPGTTCVTNRHVSVGSANGHFSTKATLADAIKGTKAVLKALKLEAPTVKAPKASDIDLGPAHWSWEEAHSDSYKMKSFVDFQNDVTANDLRLALREGFESVEHVKRFTTMGMATDQGKTSNINALGILSQESDRTVPEFGTTTFRPPYHPVTFGALGGRDLHGLLDPERTTPMHPWHLQSGAPFEDVGQWKRPWYFPKAGEDMHAAVQRECKAVRDSLGIMDASTLGKIDVKGPDAAEFLNRVYSNAFMKLAPGKCRYGLMLGEDGMIMDDGVTARIADDHFVMTTTTGGAANVLAHLEDYLQTEWQDLQVYLTSVTEQWATATIAGPNARRLMQDVCKDIDLSNEAFPFMSWREGEVLDLPARVFRISFSGELAFEINVPADYGLALWQGLIDEGRKYNITPYGTESMHVLRAEKGFIIVGQDTDGSMTPFDMGLGGMVSKVKTDFVGKRSLSRIDIVAEGRKQLVGLLTTDPKEVIPEGSHLLNEPTKEYPAPMLGFASSSYFSPNTNTSIALALVKGGLGRMGDTIYAARSDGSFIECKITSPVFFDKEGARQHA